MSFSHHEDAPNPSKRCKYLASVLKDAFSKCQTFRGRNSTSNPQQQEEEQDSDYNDEEEVFVSAIISKYMESKGKRNSCKAIDSFNWALSPTAGELFITSNLVLEPSSKEDDGDEFISVESHLSRCSSATSFDAFVSVKTCLSRCSSLSRIDSLRFDFREFRRRSIIHEFSHCEGWPFGLCRKALLLPPLPKSPSDSWLWRKSGRLVKIH